MPHHNWERKQANICWGSVLSSVFKKHVISCSDKHKQHWHHASKHKIFCLWFVAEVHIKFLWICQCLIFTKFPRHMGVDCKGIKWIGEITMDYTWRENISLHLALNNKFNLACKACYRCKCKDGYDLKKKKKQQMGKNLVGIWCFIKWKDNYSTAQK